MNRNFRDNISSGSMVLLTRVYKDGNLWRDHAWVEEEEISRFIPRTNRTKQIIEFNAKELDYWSREGTKQRLVKLRDITAVKGK